MEIREYYLKGLEGNTAGLIRYGQVPPNVGYGPDKWFATMDGRTSGEIEVTHLVSPEILIPSFVESHRFWRDWQPFASETFLDGWNPVDHCPWKKTPTREFSFGEGTTFTYGPSRTQSRNFRGHELWYVQRELGDAVIVDRACIEIWFMNKMGPDWTEWMRIAWARIISDQGVNSSPYWALDIVPQPPDINASFKRRGI